MADRTTSSFRDETISYGRSTQNRDLTGHPMHTHDICEIFCVFSGQGFYITEGSRHTFEYGKLFLMRPGESHRAELRGDEPYDRMSFHFDPSVFDSIDPERRLLAPFFNRPLGRFNVYSRTALATTDIFNTLDKLHTVHKSCYETRLFVLSQLMSLLLDLGRLFNAKMFDVPTKSSEHMREIIDYVNKNLASDISVDSVAAKFFLSRAQLNRNFKTSTGSTLWDYVVAKRLNLARSLMADGLHATKAAEASGFNDYSAFYRAYLKKYGTTPTGNVKII